MPNSVPVWDVLFYVFDIQYFTCKSFAETRRKPPQNDKDFIRMKYTGFSDIINIFAVQKYSGNVFKNRSTQGRK